MLQFYPQSIGKPYVLLFLLHEMETGKNPKVKLILRTKRAKFCKKSLLKNSFCSIILLYYILDYKKNIQLHNYNNDYTLHFDV